MGDFIKAKVIQKRSVSFAECGGDFVYIPSSDDAIGIDGEYYAVPVKKEGVFRGYDYRKLAAAPTYDSFIVTKIVEKQTGVWYWFIGTIAEWLALAKDNTPVATVVPLVIPEIDICTDEDDAGTVNFTVPGLATVAAANKYKYSLAVDGVLVEDAQNNAAAGFTDAAAIKDHLVANHAAVGTWTNPGAGDYIHLVVAASKAVGLVVVPYTV